MSVKLWVEDQAPLTAAEHAENVRWLYQTITDLVSTAGAQGVSSIVQSADGRSIVITLTNGITSTVSLPVAPFKVRGIRVTGQTYFVGDIVRVNAPGQPSSGSYVTVKQHVAVANVALDEAAGNVVKICNDGDLGQHFRGDYSATQYYYAYDIVSTGTYNVDQTFWQTFVPISPGTQSPGDNSGFWACIGFDRIPTDVVRLIAENKTLTEVITALRADIAKLKSQMAAVIPAVTNHNTRLHSLDNANYTFSPPA